MRSVCIFSDYVDNFAQYIFLRIKQPSHKKRNGAIPAVLEDSEIINRISAALASLEYRGCIQFTERKEV
jgi:hypothetical protein